MHGGTASRARLTVVDGVDCRDFAAQRLHDEGGHGIANVSARTSAGSALATLDAHSPMGHLAPLASIHPTPWVSHLRGWRWPVHAFRGRRPPQTWRRRQGTSRRGGEGGKGEEERGRNNGCSHSKAVCVATKGGEITRGTFCRDVGGAQPYLPAPPRPSKPMRCLCADPPTQSRTEQKTREKEKSRVL